MELYENKKTVEDFRHDYEAGKISHAFIIEGERGSGRLTLARTLASILTKDKKRTMTGTHPDVHELLFLDRAGQIKIEEVRDMIKLAHIVPTESEYNVFIIENAQAMRQDSQNTLLQIFEEPPSNTLFFLLTTDKNLLLKTLLSRARVFKTEKLSKELISQILSQRFPDKIERCDRVAALSQGFLGVALELMNSESLFETLDFVDSYMSLVADGASLFELSRAFSPVTLKQIQRPVLALRVNYVAQAMRDVVLISASDSVELSYFENDDVPKRIAQSMSQAKAVEIFELCGDIQKRVNSLNVACAIADLNSHFARQS